MPSEAEKIARAMAALGAARAAKHKGKGGKRGKGKRRGGAGEPTLKELEMLFGARKSPKAPHQALRDYCIHCGTYHSRGKHRSHGRGSFRRTHPGG